MKGRVIKSTGSWYHCQLEDGQMVNARAIGKFRLKGLKVTNPFAVGDYVELEIEPGHETAIIKELYDRENYIIRKSPRHPAKNHIILCNLHSQIKLITRIYLNNR